MRTITVTGGYTDYAVGTVTEATNKDLSGATIKAALLSISTVVPPVSSSPLWRTPVVVAGVGTAKVSLLVGVETAPGDYYLWIDIADNPTVVPIKAATPIRVV